MSHHVSYPIMPTLGAALLTHREERDAAGAWEAAGGGRARWRASAAPPPKMAGEEAEKGGRVVGAMAALSAAKRGGGARAEEVGREALPSLLPPPPLARALPPPLADEPFRVGGLPLAVWGRRRGLALRFGRRLRLLLGREAAAEAGRGLAPGGTGARELKGRGPAFET